MPRKTHDDSVETRNAILASAQRLFARRGFERTSLSDVAKYAGFTRGAIYWHFENKEDLLISLIDHLDQSMFSTGLLAEATDPKEQDPLGKFKQWIKILVSEENTKFMNSSFFTMILGIFIGQSDNEKLIEKTKQMRIERKNVLCSVLRNAVNKGQLPSNLDIESAAEALSLFMVGIIHESRGDAVPKLFKNIDFTINLLIDNLRFFTKESLAN